MSAARGLFADENEPLFLKFILFLLYSPTRSSVPMYTHTHIYEADTSVGMASSTAGLLIPLQEDLRRIRNNIILKKNDVTLREQLITFQEDAVRPWF